MASISLNPELEARLARVAADTGRSFDDVVREALAEYIEDHEDGERALENVKRNEATSSLDEVERRLKKLNGN
jgi:predicted DNA-binding protein